MSLPRAALGEQGLEQVDERQRFLRVAFGSERLTGLSDA